MGRPRHPQNQDQFREPIKIFRKDAKSLSNKKNKELINVLF